MKKHKVQEESEDEDDDKKSNNKKQGKSNQGNISRNQDQWSQRMIRSCSNRFKWNEHVFGP